MNAQIFKSMFMALFLGAGSTLIVIVGGWAAQKVLRAELGVGERMATALILAWLACFFGATSLHSENEPNRHYYAGFVPSFLAMLIVVTSVAMLYRASNLSSSSWLFASVGQLILAAIVLMVIEMRENSRNTTREARW